MLIIGCALVFASVVGLGFAIDHHLADPRNTASTWNRGYFEGFHQLPLDRRLMGQMTPAQRTDYLNGRRCGWNVRVQQMLSVRVDQRMSERRADAL